MSGPETATGVPARARERKGVHWRWWIHVLHRDIGYSIFALTFIYAVSGVALNHAHQWNPHYVVTHGTAQVGPVDRATAREPHSVEAMLRAAGLDTPYRTTFQKDPDTLRIFLEEGTVDVDLASGVAHIEIIRHRPVLHEFNFLHLNDPKRLWTWVADLYASLLAFVALTGLLMRRGEAGLLGRGKWFVAGGLAVPVLFLLLYL